MFNNESIFSELINMDETVYSHISWNCLTALNTIWELADMRNSEVVIVEQAESEWFNIVTLT